MGLWGNVRGKTDGFVIILFAILPNNFIAKIIIIIAINKQSTDI